MYQCPTAIADSFCRGWSSKGVICKILSDSRLGLKACMPCSPDCAEMEGSYSECRVAPLEDRGYREPSLSYHGSDLPLVLLES